MRSPRTKRTSCAFIVLVAWVAAAICAPAPAAWQDLPAAGAPAALDRPNVSTHGWFAVDDPEAGGAILAHVPPRRVRGPDGKSHGAADGTVRRAADLPELPVAMAAVDDRVYVMFTRAGALSVGSVTARLTAAADLWSFEPPGRLRSHPDLPSKGRLLAFAGSPLGPVAFQSGGDPGDTFSAELSILIDDVWRQIPLPDARRLGELDRCVLATTRDGLAILAVDPHGYGTLWQSTASWRDPAPEPVREGADTLIAQDPELEIVWKPTPVALDGSLKNVELEGARLVCAGGLLTLASRGPDDTMVVTSLTEQSSYRIAEVPTAQSLVAIVPLDAPGRLVFAKSTPKEAQSTSGPKQAPMRLEVREISAFTGRVFYRGEGRSDLPVSAREIRVLTVLLVGVMVVVLLVVLRRDPDGGVYSLPEGMSLAEPGRRFFAGLLDFAIATLIASRFLGIPLAEVVSPTGVLEGQGWVVVGVALGVGLVIGTLTEWLTGRSPGKLLVGCEVVDIRPPVAQARRPTLLQALVRNLVKWGVPPAAVFGLLEGEGRHRGDSIARTAVAVEGAEEEPEGEDF